jgi:hypothetical protein
MACENGIAGERDARHGHSSAAFDQVVQDNSFRADWTGLDWNRIDPPLPAEKEPQVIEPRTVAIDHSCVSCPGPCMLPLVWR